MIPFSKVADYFVDSVKSVMGCERVKSYYFHNCPVGYLYQDSLLTQHLPVKDFIDGLSGKSVIVVVFSDAGAARGGWNEKRIKRTHHFLVNLKESSSIVCWVNPMPMTRWKGSSAGAISCLIGMESIESDSESLLSILSPLHWSEGGGISE